MTAKVSVKRPSRRHPDRQRILRILGQDVCQDAKRGGDTGNRPADIGDHDVVVTGFA